MTGRNNSNANDIPAQALPLVGTYLATRLPCFAPLQLIILPATQDAVKARTLPMPAPAQHVADMSSTCLIGTAPGADAVAPSVSKC